ncbi:heavy-metal-associated domain-containing protein [Kribbella catacumbae]|uniref:heavy-metal-associated domain-containing protein n=1 Tax=Kribbella catacumbae TaxID=460086 RepID=UPI0003675FF0|nr:copper ion binding protein [Kribbella catacumbae]
MCNACSCGTTDATTTEATTESLAAAETAVFSVTGMTCGHCVSSVTSEVSRIDGVSAVNVDLASGSVTVTSEQPVGRDAVRVAVEEAGYQLADA